MAGGRQADGHTKIAIPWLAVALIAASALAYEILLIRLFAIVQWYHYGYMVISLALLGHGVSGSFIFLFQRWLLSHYRWVFLVNGLLFAGGSVACFLAAQRVPFNNLAMLWDGAQWLLLTLIYGLLLLPFFFAANCIGLTICRFAGAIPRVYACDLLGAALGAAGMVLLLYYTAPMAALLLVSILSLCACAIASHQWLPRYRLHWLLLPLAVLLLNLPETWLQLQPAPYKRLSKALLLPQTRVVETRSSPLGQLDVVESPTIPFRHAPGISINSRRLIPDQLAIFDDADDFSAIARYDGDLQSLAYLDDLTSALPYHLLDRPRADTRIPGQVTGSRTLNSGSRQTPVSSTSRRISTASQISV